MSDEVRRIRVKMREELSTWIEARIPEFIETFGGEPPELPMVEDFRLMLCITDGADFDSCTYYPIVDSGSSYHRQMGLVTQAAQYLARPGDDDE